MWKWRVAGTTARRTLRPLLTQISGTKALYSPGFPSPFLGRFFRHEISQLWEKIPAFKFLMPPKTGKGGGKRGGKEAVPMVELLSSQGPGEMHFFHLARLPSEAAPGGPSHSSSNSEAQPGV